MKEREEGIASSILKLASYRFPRALVFSMCLGSAMMGITDESQAQGETPVAAGTEEDLEVVETGLHHFKGQNSAREIITFMRFNDLTFKGKTPEKMEQRYENFLQAVTEELRQKNLWNIGPPNIRQSRMIIKTIAPLVEKHFPPSDEGRVTLFDLLALGVSDCDARCLLLLSLNQDLGLELPLSFFCSPHHAVLLCDHNPGDQDLGDYSVDYVYIETHYREEEAGTRFGFREHQDLEETGFFRPTLAFYDPLHQWIGHKIPSEGIAEFLFYHILYHEEEGDFKSPDDQPFSTWALTYAQETYNADPRFSRLRVEWKSFLYGIDYWGQAYEEHGSRHPFIVLGHARDLVQQGAVAKARSVLKAALENNAGFIEARDLLKNLEVTSEMPQK